MGARLCCFCAAGSRLLRVFHGAISPDYYNQRYNSLRPIHELARFSMPCGVLPAGAPAACLLIVPVCGAQASSVVLSPAMEDAFGASSIPLNGTTTLTYTITNPAANVTEDLGVSFTDFIPIGITPFAFGAHAACGGTFRLDPEGDHDDQARQHLCLDRADAGRVCRMAISQRLASPLKLRF